MLNFVIIRVTRSNTIYAMNILAGFFSICAIFSLLSANYRLLCMQLLAVLLTTLQRISWSTKTDLRECNRKRKSLCYKVTEWSARELVKQYEETQKVVKTDQKTI